jgi:hypothetical protein
VSRPFEIRLEPRPPRIRRGLFALELLDPVTLVRVSQGVKVVAEGLRAKPIVNAGGLFVWPEEDIGRLRSVSIDPQTLPYEKIELLPADLQLPPVRPPITTIMLSPCVNYPFSAGITGLRGMLVEERVSAPGPRTPVVNAEVRPRWLDEDGVTWRDSPASSRTDAKGSFAAFLRLAPADAPQLSPAGAVSVRLRVIRETRQRDSAVLTLPQGRIADHSTFAQGLEALILAWDELQT